MKRNRVLSLLIVVLLAAMPLTALAQDGDGEWQEFVSEDELLTAEYPDSWGSYVDEDMPFPTVTFINSEEGVERFDTDEDMMSGDAAVIVMLLPGDLLAFMGVELTDETTIEEVAGMFAEFIAVESMSEEDMGTLEIGEAELLEFGEDEDMMEAGYVTLSDDETDGTVVVFELDEGLYVLGMITAYTGEYTDELEETGLGILSTVSYDGTAMDIMMQLMGGGDDE